jgi:chromatin modification-related protein VID21
MLLRLIRDYAWNWRLIADLFNSARGTISTDKRSAWDCYHRWDQKWGPTSKATAAVSANAQAEPILTPAQQEFQQARAQAQAIALANHTQTGATGPPPTSALPINAVPETTPIPASAVLTSAISTSITGVVDDSADANGITSPGTARREAKLQREARYQGSKRKVRNNTMRDAIRRSQKRRDINRKNSRKAAVFGIT